EIVKILLVVLLSSVKFIAGPPFAYYDNQYDFSFLETNIYCITGGMLGVLLFSFFSEQIDKFWHWLKPKVLKLIERFLKKEVKPAPKKVFTKRNRMIVTVWMKYGALGIAFLTPVLLSIPIGTIIANYLVKDKKTIYWFMFMAITFWSVVMTGMFELFHVVTIEDLQKQILK
ncbi:MAG: hypothetical protein KJO64_05645, partial [Bacteroidia bacterium]|nr:hypothetical protein [Bacteroidia bacterium]